MIAHGPARLGITGVASFLVGVASLLSPAPAWAPPAYGASGINVRSECVAYGQAIAVTGGGYAPTSRVTASAGPGHFVGATTWASAGNASARADANGSFSLALRAGRDHAGTFHPLIVSVSATGRSGMAEDHAVPLVIASPSVCRTLISTNRRS